MCNILHYEYSTNLSRASSTVCVTHAIACVTSLMIFNICIG